MKNINESTGLTLYWNRKSRRKHSELPELFLAYKGKVLVTGIHIADLAYYVRRTIKKIDNN